ncbi:MAG: cadherin domain-containing protein [Pirellulales bacterium]
MVFQFMRRWSARRPGKLAATRRSRRRGGWTDSIEQLEARRVMAVTIAIDYSYDTNNFFDTQAKRDLLQQAADSIGQYLNDSLSAIVPGNKPGAGSWSALFTAPGTGLNVSESDLTIPANTILVYAGGRDLGGSGGGFVLGQGGPGGWNASGNKGWFDTVEARGQSGALANPATDFGPWGGSIVFTTNSSVKWHYGSTTAGLDSNEADFLTVATHELCHLLGFGISDSWDRYVNTTTDKFSGPASVAEYDGDGDVPLSPEDGHWANGVTEGGKATLMDPSIFYGERSVLTKLDLAGLDDLGWTVTYPVVNGPPTSIALSNAEIVENSPANTQVGTLTTTDPDTGDTFTYSLVSGTGSTDNGSFQLVGNQLEAVSGFDFEAKSSYFVRVRSTDAGGLSVEKVFAILVTDQDEPPTGIQLSTATVSENAGLAATVGTLSLIDPDGGDNPAFTYSLVEGTGADDNASFTIVGDQLQTSADFDFESKNGYSVRVLGTDGANLSFEQVFAVSVTDVNEAPTLIALNNASVPENGPLGAVVGTLSTVDPDAGNSFTYSLVSGTGSEDNGSFQIAGDQLQAAVSFDFEARSGYSVRVRSTDAGGLSTEQVFAVSVTDVNEAPTLVALSNSSVAENGPVGAVVGTLSSVDPDAGSSFTYSLVSGTASEDNGSFQIVGDQLQAAASFDFETRSSYSVRVRSTDAGGLSTEQIFAVSVTDVLEVVENTPDYDGDGDVDSADLVGFLADWTGALEPGTGGMESSPGDLDDDGDVDSSDLAAFLEMWTGSLGAGLAPTGMVSTAVPPSNHAVDLLFADLA